jgi:hypothetical protein
MEMINLEHIDYGSIRDDIDKYLKSLSTYSEITSVLNSSNLELLKNIVAGYATYVSYKTRMNRQESYIDTAQLESSLFFLFKMYGYNVKRYTSPKIRLKYNDVSTIPLNYGDILGHYNDYDIIYNGDFRKIEKGDYIYACIAKIKEEKLDFNNDELVYNLKPEELKSIEEVRVIINDKLIKPSRDPEDFIIYNKPVEFSSSFYDCELFVRDRKSGYGIKEEISSLEVLKMETNGEENIDILNINVDKFLVMNIEHNGSFGEDLEKAKKIVPLYYQTMRRAVTIRDYLYILKSFYLFKDVFVKKDEGVPLTYNVTLSDNFTGKDLKLNVYGNIYSFNFPAGTTKDDAYDQIITVIKDSSMVDVSKNKSSKGGILMAEYDARLRDFSVTSGNEEFNIVIEKDRVEPLCCTMLCYYILEKTKDDYILLSQEERKEVSSYIDRYKTGSVIFIPAKKKSFNIDLIIDSNNFDVAKKKIEDLLKEYELQLQINFYYGDFLAKVGEIEEVKYVIPNQEPFDIELDGTFYIKFETNIKIRS